MSDIQTMKEMITGLEQKKKNLQANEKVFLKLSGINEEIEKAVQDSSGYDEELTDAKSVRDAAKKKKADAVSKTTESMAEKMNAVLHDGSVIFTYSEDDEGKRSMKIGWKHGKITTPYKGLSGMQKQVFDAALAHVLDANIIVVEAAELDEQNLQDTLKQLSGLDKQVIVNTCHPLVGLEIPENFTVVEV